MPADNGKGGRTRWRRFSAVRMAEPALGSDHADPNRLLPTIRVLHSCVLRGLLVLRPRLDEYHRHFHLPLRQPDEKSPIAPACYANPAPTHLNSRSLKKTGAEPDVEQHARKSRTFRRHTANAARGHHCGRPCLPSLKGQQSCPRCAHRKWSRVTQILRSSALCACGFGIRLFNLQAKKHRV
jgi:hypothetical protein